MTPATALDLGGVRRVLVIRRRALGDALVTLPAVLALRDALPAAGLDLVVDRSLAPLFTGIHGVDLLPWDGATATWSWLRTLRRRRYDLVVDYLSTPRTAVWTAFSGARLRVGYDLRWRSWAYNVRVPRRTGRGPLRQFAGESFADPLRALGLSPTPWRARLPFAFADDDLAADYRTWRDATLAGDGPRVGLVLSATWPAKAWPLARAAELARSLHDTGTSTLLLPGPGEETILAPLRETAPTLRWAPPTGLPELADLIGRLDAVVSTDSGPRHLAAAAGVPTVTLYGPTDPAGWNQEHPLHVAVRTGEPCSPCDLETCPVPGHPCLANLEAERVVDAVRTVLARAETVDPADR